MKPKLKFGIIFVFESNSERQFFFTSRSHSFKIDKKLWDIEIKEISRLCNLFLFIMFSQKNWLLNAFQKGLLSEYMGDDHSHYISITFFVDQKIIACMVQSGLKIFFSSWATVSLYWIRSKLEYAKFFMLLDVNCIKNSHPKPRIQVLSSIESWDLLSFLCLKIIDIWNIFQSNRKMMMFFMRTDVSFQFFYIISKKSHQEQKSLILNQRFR